MKVGLGADESGIAHVRLDDDRGNASRVLTKEVRDRPGIVERRRQREAGQCRGDPRTVGQTQRGDPGARLHEKAIGVPVIAALELHDELAARDRAGQPHAGHGRLGPAVHEAHHLETRHAPPHRFGELDFRLARRAVGPAARHGLCHGGEHCGMRVAQDQRPPGADVVQVLAAVDIGDAGAVGVRDKKWRPADCPERPHG